jgi:hypothetical protein
MITQVFTSWFELHNPILDGVSDKGIFWTCDLTIDKIMYKGEGVTPEIAFSLAMADMRKKISLAAL